ncbi:DUF58 domain-containing protein [Chloroflexota bacterium]
MNKLPFNLLCQIYLLLVLLAAAVLSPLPYSPLALILLAVMLFATFRSLPPRINIVIMVTIIFLLPLILEPLLKYPTSSTPLPLTARQFMAVIAILPAIYPLDYALRQNAQIMTLAYNMKGRHPTSISNSLFVSILVLLIVSLILDNRTLLFAGIMLILYLLAILTRVLKAVPGQPLDVPTTKKRIITGTTGDIPLYATSKAAMRLHCRLSPANTWAKIIPQIFTVNRAGIALDLTITPPLAGPIHPQLQISAIDPWAFIQVNRIIEPVELHVIPRARHAEWLAMKYLGQTGAGGAASTALPPREILIPRRGIEYFDSRNYQPGDQLRDIDWKHTLKLNQLIIKEHIEAGEQSAIIAVNLSVTDAEAADKLAFNLITTALTLAHQAIPTALAAYNHERVILTTTVTDAREILKQTLLLVKDITPVEFAHRFLDTPNIGKLRRTITQLKQTTSEPAQRLLGMLDFEYQAIEQAAKNHSATLALSQVAKHLPPPAVIILVSQLNQDTEALPVTMDKFTRRGFTTMRMEEANQILSLTATHKG